MKLQARLPVLCAFVLALHPALAAESSPLPDPGGVPQSKLYDYGVMSPPATADIVAGAVAAVDKPMAPGPFQATWPSIKANYKTPGWYADAKFGIFLHWGLYSAAAHHNEWYEKHMYGADAAWHGARRLAR